MSTGNWPSNLAQLLAPVIQPIENVVFKQKRVSLDGYRFKNCAFVDCEVFTKTGNFVLEECFSNERTTFYFVENAIRVAKLASLLDFVKSPALRALFHADGSFTIK